MDHQAEARRLVIVAWRNIVDFAERNGSMSDLAELRRLLNEARQEMGGVEDGKACLIRAIHHADQHRGENAWMLWNMPRCAREITLYAWNAEQRHAEDWESVKEIAGRVVATQKAKRMGVL